MNWTPAVGQVLKHKTISQRIVLLERRDLGGSIFWLVEEHAKYGKPGPWMIAEKHLIDQHDLTEGKAP